RSLPQARLAGRPASVRPRTRHKTILSLEHLEERCLLSSGSLLSPNLESLDANTALPLMTDSQGRVEVSVTCTNPTTLAPILASAGMNVVSVLPQYHRVEGYIPWSALPTVSGLGGQGLMGILGVPNLLTSVGSVTSEGVNVMEADRVQASTPGYNGTGVKVG